MKFINIGYGNVVNANRIVTIVGPESAPIRRIIQESREKGRLIDARHGRRTRSAIITNSDHVILSAIQPFTIANRLDTKFSVGSYLEEEEEREDEEERLEAEEETEEDEQDEQNESEIE